MDNVNFRCGHCGQLMAVGSALLGQQVRCPHCQQIVLAPVAVNPAPVPPPEPAVTMVPPPPLASGLMEILPSGVPPISELDSIFTSPESNSDALFGGPQRGLVEMPPDPLPLPPLDPPAAPPPVDPTGGGPIEPTMTYLAEWQPPAPNGGEATTEADASAFPLSPPAAKPSDAESTALDHEALAQAIPKPQIRPPVDRGGWLLALLVVPLISYSVLATIAVVYLRFFQAPPAQPHPLEMIPDIEGENPGARHTKRKVSVNFHERQEKDLPAHLRTALQAPIRVGDVEVTPLSVELRPIEFMVRGKDPVLSDTPALVLNLHLKNVSTDVAFCPLDPYFERRWKETKGETKTGMPFTYLTVGRERFFGGPIGLAEREERGESIKGQRLGRELQPGEELTTFICTSPEDAVAEAVESSTQPMLWRVQVRRGLVTTPNYGERSASAVVGVEFTREDVRHVDNEN